MKCLFISSVGDAGELDLCLKAQGAGHLCKWFFPANPRTEAIGKGMVERVKDWREWMRWADLVILGDNTKYLRELDAWRSREGIKIVGATKDAASWELNRTLGQRVFEDAGIDTVPYKEFSSYDDAINHVKKTMQRYVCKPCGDEPDKSLSYVSKSPEDMVFMLSRWKRQQRHKGKFILQDFIPGIEMAVGGFFGPGGFNEGWWENWEEKALMAGGTGPSTGEQGTTLRVVKKSKLAKEVLAPLEDHLAEVGYIGYVDINTIIDEKGNAWPLEFTCYDDETEVLTSSGWKTFKDVSLGEQMATLNPNTDEMEFHPNRGIIKKQGPDEMIHFHAENGGLDLKVTPDHQMWVKPRGKEYLFKRADELTGQPHLVRRGYTWRGVEKDAFAVPAHTEMHVLGRHKKTHPIEHPAVSMPMDVWMKFLGLYISEGCVTKSGYIVTISQAAKNHKKILPLLDGFPFKYSIQKNGALQFHSVQLGRYLNSFAMGYAHEKFVPKDFMCLAPKYLSALLEGLIAGDGCTHKRSGQRMYGTCSKRLADDVQELMIKIGGIGRIVRGPRAGSTMTIGGKSYARNHDQYIVTERTKKIDAWTDRRATKRVPYNGAVYCCDVPPHHLLYVRRKGVAAWCGNCRFGWPTINIQQELFESDVIEWLADLSEGRDSRRLKLNKIASGLVLAIPHYPYLSPLDKVVGVPVYGMKEKLHPHLHPAMMAWGDGPQELNGKIVQVPMPLTSGDYVMIISGSGDTVREAQKQTHQIVKQIKIPSSPFWRPDIGSRLKTQLGQLQAMGYATQMEF